jgi:Transcriptional regulators
MTTRSPEDKIHSVTTAAAAVPAPSGEPGGKPGRTGVKHRELTEALRALVAGMRPGDRLPTQEALMRQFHVSDTTVLRSLEDLKREGRIVRRQGSGTFVAGDAPATPATTPPPSRSRLVAVMSRPNISPFFSDMVQAVEANLGQHDLAPVLIVDTDVERRVRRTMAHWGRGEIIGALHIGSAILTGLEDLPTILIGESARDRDFCQVSLDNTLSGRRVGEYLWDLGHRNVAVVTIKVGGAPDAPPLQGVDRVRVAGIRALWEERGGVWREDWQIAHPFLLRPDDRRAVDVMRSYLEPLFPASGPRPTAIFAVHDEMALVAIRALEDMGLSVPDDVSVIGFNDAGTLAAFFRPSLTTVRTPCAALATLAVHLFLDLLRTPENRPRSIRLPPEIIVRDSTGPAPLPLP